MEDYKIRVANEAESEEAIGLGVLLGFEKPEVSNGRLGLVYLSDGFIGTDRISFWDDYDDEKEITLPQLKDLVVLKRNDVCDATHVRGDGKKYFHAQSTDYFYQFGGDEWVLSTWMNYQLLPQLQPIEPKMSILDTGRLEMKEYLVKDIDGSYKLVVHSFKCCEDWIEIPACSEAAYFFSGSDLKRGKDDIAFYKDNIGSVYNGDDWLEIDAEKVKPFVLNKGVLLWKRHTQPEALPFIDEPKLEIATGLELDRIAFKLDLRGRNNGETDEEYRYQLLNYAGKAITDDLPLDEDFIFNPLINERYAEIEKVRQKTVQDTLAERQKEYGSFEDVAFVTQGLVDFLSRHTKYDEMPKTHKEALHMIASKVARLTLGNHNHKDSWHDIGGYSKLIEDLLD